MDIKNLVVVNLISPTEIMSSMETSTLLECRICRKEMGGYRDLETDRYYSDEFRLGVKRIQKGTLVPFSKYYNVLGIKRLRSPKNRKEVHQKVKILRREGKL